MINQETLRPAQGFATHHPRDMQILTLVIQGAITHKDSLGNQTVISVSELPCMTAGTGIEHSEFNLSADNAVKLLQIWLRPERRGLVPNYQQKKMANLPWQTLSLLAAPEPSAEALFIHQDAWLWLGRLPAYQAESFPNLRQRYLWLQILTGQIRVADSVLQPGDGLAIFDEMAVSIFAETESEYLLFN